ncbi:EmrB/QacA subfamily drug resistance transporter [Pullulanibacillus pueri]|uniref:MFS transporter n=1 Tax=Pullulanibacillus pueri TaxID=1437324 RepID=A0A8J3EJV9_9BACL|nr:MDR family MFS transporter [Pullulanibacillus pueri]MBM7680354.1 EmrB/QacA subfamily drug resistance transporter [Pullulanibacillus pueri]GGH75492.1 MFS transporter [Pullulanibacillus pueri]
MKHSNNRKFGLIVTGLLLGIFMSAMDQTIVATAMGTIVSELGGLDKFVWVTSAYLVTEMAGMPIFGKLSDMYGRKRFFIAGIIFFLVGSILCGTATGIVQLSIYRAIQGIGGGALMPIAFAIVFDVFPPEKRGKMGGIFGAVFGVSSIVGPLLGSFITETWSWHWIFYINVPIGLVAILLIARYYKESQLHQRQKIDWWGALSLVISVVCLMFGLELGGKAYAWDSATILSLFVAFAVFFIVFIVVETKVEAPIISFKMFKKRLFAVSTLLSVFYGAAFVIPIVFIPIFVQGVYGGGATNSGLILLPMLLGNVASSMVGGALAQKFSYRSLMFISCLFLLPGLYLLGTLNMDTPRSLLTLYMILTGLGVGFSFSVVSIAAIHHFEPQQFGSVNSTVSFIREFGMTISLVIYGTIQSHLMVNGLTEKVALIRSKAFSGVDFSEPRVLLSKELRAHIPSPVLHQMTDILSTSLATTFLWTLIPGGLALVTVFFMGKEKMRRFEKPSPSEKNA